MGGTLSCGGKGYKPEGEDMKPYGSPTPTCKGGLSQCEQITQMLSPTDCSRVSQVNNNNIDDSLKKPAEGNAHSPSHRKFWQFLSLRRSRRAKDYESQLASSLNRDMEINVNLPDVVDSKQDVKRSSSLKPPPKPPRLFLFRSSSINTPRSSVVGETDRNSFVFSEAYQVGSANNGTGNAPAGAGKENKDPNGIRKDIKIEPIKVIPESQLNILAPKSSNSLPSPIGKLSDPVITRPRPLSPIGKIKIVSPDLSRKPASRPRKKSGEITAEDRHVLILQSATELICQKLDPFVIIEDLAAANLITKDEFVAYRGTLDQRSMCENIVQSVVNRDYKSFLAFVELLRGKADYSLVAAVLDAMRAVYDVIYEVPARIGDMSPILDDEKSISFDVVYYSPESGKIRSVVELEKSRNTTENKRHSRDLLSFKRNSRLSFHSLTSEASSVFSVDIINTGIPMVTVAIAGHTLCSDKAQALATVIENHSCILELHIGKTHLKGADMEPIGRALMNNTSIRVVDLRLNNIGNDGAACLAKVLSHNDVLGQLILSSTGISTEGCGVVAEALKTNTSLIDLDLSFLDIGDSGCLALRDMLKQNRCLRKLRLRSANISWIGCGFILEGIELGKTVTELDLSRNFIGDDGADMFNRHLKDESSLRELNLENCGITSIGCSIISDVILTNKSLKSLDISVNFIGDQGILRLSNALMRNKHIRTLGLNMCGISNDGFSKLLDILESNATLSLVKLCYNRLGREHINPEATSDNLKYRIRIVTSSNPKLKLLLWGNSFEESHSNSPQSPCTDITATL